MTKKLNSIAMLSMISALSAITESEYGNYGKPKHYRKDKPNFDQIIIGETKISEETKMIKKGLKKFVFRDNQNNIVWALNQKNADRKAKKLGYL